MIIFSRDKEGQLSLITSTKELVQGQTYIIDGLLEDNKYFLETIDIEKDSINYACDRLGRPLYSKPFIKKNNNILSKCEISKGDHVIFLRKPNYKKQDPLVIIFEVKNTVDNTIIATLIKKQRHGEGYDKNTKKFEKSIKFRIEKNFTNGEKVSYSSFKRVVNEFCFFISEVNDLVTLGKSNNELKINGLHFFKEDIPSFLLANISYSKNESQYITEFKTLNHLNKDDFYNNIDDLYKTFGIIDDLHFVTTINGYCFMAFCRGKRIYPIIKNENNELDVVEINTNHNKLIRYKKKVTSYIHTTFNEDAI